MNIDYKIDLIKHRGGDTVVTYSIYEGDYQDVEDIDLGTINTYVRSNRLDQTSVVLPGIVPDVTSSLNSSFETFVTNSYPNHTIIPAQQA